MKNVLYVLTILLFVLALFVTFYPSPSPISPLSSVKVSSPVIHNSKFIILGFAPYWNLKKISDDSLNNITHFAYFHLLLNADGSVYKKVNRLSQDPGFTNYLRLISGNIAYNKVPLIITFMPESQEALSASISSVASRNRTIATIKEVLRESNAMGVNIDYEPLGDVSQSTQNNFTQFIKELKNTLRSSQISVSVYASSAKNNRLWDLASLSKDVDYFVIMSYDYTMPGSNIAGPNSPLRGSGSAFEHDITKNIAELTKIVPKEKLLLGIPFYGYEWETTDSTKYSPTEGRGSVASFERIEKMLNDKTLELLWDRNTLTPYGVSTQSGRTTQIYFDNPTSLRLKIDFVKSAGLGGIAIWALGYEGNNSWVWDIIKSLNK